MSRSPPERIKTFGGAASASVALIAATAGLTEGLMGIREGIRTVFGDVWSTWILWLVVFIASIVGINLLWQGLSRKSRLLRPEALLIDPDNPDHLKGREDDIRRLREAVARHPLVFLEGESGSGKSALIRSGLIRSLTGNAEQPQSLLPIYLNSYGTDWEDGPQEQLVEAFWSTLGPERRETLGVSTLHEVRTQLWSAAGRSISTDRGEEQGGLNPPAGLLYRSRNELGLTSVLIFDQFDDYQVAHRPQFLQEGRWTPARQLAEQNRFWREIRDALKDNTLHCLVVTRSELYGGLESVRFLEPEAFFLERVESAYITVLLEQLTTPLEDKQPVISNPQAGWEALKNRLIRDLTHQGRILPMQARIVFKGLINLPFLSVGTYERAGRMEGLEAGYIEDGVSSAATRSELSRPVVLQSLLEMVDDSNPEAPKARAVTKQRLLTRGQAAEAQGSRMLEVLKQQGIVRAHVAKNAAHQAFDWQARQDAQTILTVLVQGLTIGAVVQTDSEESSGQRVLDE